MIMIRPRRLLTITLAQPPRRPSCGPDPPTDDRVPPTQPGRPLWAPSPGARRAAWRMGMRSRRAALRGGGTEGARRPKEGQRARRRGGRVRAPI